MQEWQAAQPGDAREIGLLPFPIDDVMCPGETKALHLYEVCRWLMYRYVVASFTRAFIGRAIVVVNLYHTATAVVLTYHI